MRIAPQPLLAIVMARRADPGRVKTRLCAGGSGDSRDSAAAVDPERAAEIATALLRCVVRRLARHFDVALAATPDGSGQEILNQAGVPGRFPVLDQGEGDLGERLGRVWALPDPRRPVAFFGIDSPDVPDAALAEVEPSLAHADVAAGRTADGGYWTLAVRRRDARLLHGIDWGSASVYDQTRRRAGEAGLAFQALPPWHDVDRPEDLALLRRRLREGPLRGGADPALEELSERLEAVLTG